MSTNPPDREALRLLLSAARETVGAAGTSGDLDALTALRTAVHRVVDGLCEGCGGAKGCSAPCWHCEDGSDPLADTVVTAPLLSPDEL